MNETQEGQGNMGITVKDQFEVWRKEAKSTLGKAKRGVDNFLEPLPVSFKDNTIANIPEIFGKFLYSCLGERVTGQRSSTLNKTILASDKYKYIAEKATEKKCTVDEYLQEHDYHTDYRGTKIFNQTQAYLTAGRKFGVSYVTGEGDRSHTIYFEEGMIFKYFTQEHVDCVKNKAKRECSQSFLDFRNQFVAGLNALNDDNIIDLNVPVQIAKVSTITSANMLGRYENRDKQLSAVVVESVYDDVVELATISTPEYSVWDKTHSVASCNAKSMDQLIPAFSLQYGSIRGNKSQVGNKPTTLFGNVDVTISSIGHTFQTIDSMSDDAYVAAENAPKLKSFDQIINKKAISQGRYYGSNNVNHIDGLVLNMIDIIQHPAVQDAIKTRIGFFTSQSVALQELKHRYSELYFLNSDCL